MWAFGSLIESDMNAAENAARKRHGGKKGNAEKFVHSERLRVLGKHLKEDIKRFREPGEVKVNKVNKDKEESSEQVLGTNFFKLKGQ